MTFLDTVSQAVSQSAVGAWGAVVSTGLAGIKVWETFFKDRLKLATSWVFTGDPGGAHVIYVANLSPTPVQVEAWTVAYKPRPFHWNIDKVELTYDDNEGFKIDGHSNKPLLFAGMNKFVWAGDAPPNTNLWLTLHIFGRKRSKRLLVYSPWKR